MLKEKLPSSDDTGSGEDSTDTVPMVTLGITVKPTKLVPERVSRLPTGPATGETVKTLAGTLWVALAEGAAAQLGMLAVMVLLESSAVVLGTFMVVAKAPDPSGITCFCLIPP